MPKHRTITEAAAKKFKHPERGQIDHFDQSYPGLHLRVGARLKSWGYYYRINGKLKRTTFDSFPAMGVGEAHDAWRKARDAVHAGRDPAARAVSATDFENVFGEWMQRDQAKRRTARVVAKMFEREILPHWKHLPITSIGRRECLQRIDHLADQGKIIAARRLQEKLHRLFRWCVSRQIITINPLADVEKPGAETKRDRVLSDAEVVKVWNAAEQLGYPYGPAVQLLLLTGARRDEIARLRWDEIIDGNIELSGLRTKNGKAHSISLSSVAQVLLADLPRIGDFVFGTKPISGWSVAKTDLDSLAEIEPWRIHDLRRTVATGLQKQGVVLQVTDAVLGHTAGSRAGVVGVYQRHDYAAEKRAALEAWSVHVTDLVEG